MKKKKVSVALIILLLVGLVVPVSAATATATSAYYGYSSTRNAGINVTGANASSMTLPATVPASSGLYGVYYQKLNAIYTITGFSWSTSTGVNAVYETQDGIWHQSNVNGSSNTETGDNYTNVIAVGVMESSISTVLTVNSFSSTGTQTGSLPSPPAAPTSLGVSSTTGTSIALTWTGSAGTSITYNVYENGTKMQTGLTGTTYTVTGLTPSTTYQFYVTAVNGVGESGASNTVSGTTQSPPAAPTNVGVASVTSQSVSLNWDNSTSATGYNIYENGTLVNATPYPTNSYTINNLSPSTSYSFQVTAVNSVGESAKSASVSATTQAPPPFTLTSPNDGTVASTGVLTWTPVSSNPSGTSYNVYRNGSLIGNTSTGTWTDPNFSPYASYTLAATYAGSAAAPMPVSGSGIVSTSSANWGFQASDIWSNSVNLIVSISGFLLLILAVIFASDIRFFLKHVFEKYRGRVKM